MVRSRLRRSVVHGSLASGGHLGERSQTERPTDVLYDHARRCNARVTLDLDPHGVLAVTAEVVQVQLVLPPGQRDPGPRCVHPHQRAGCGDGLTRCGEELREGPVLPGGLQAGLLGIQRRQWRRPLRRHNMSTDDGGAFGWDEVQSEARRRVRRPGSGGNAWQVDWALTCGHADAAAGLLEHALGLGPLPGAVVGNS